MGASKSIEFTVKDNKLAKYAKALAHPARIAILQLLAKKQTCICGDIVDEIPLSQSTVSQHLIQCNLPMTFLKNTTYPCRI
jgi:DNA-binding transcriptional ArsR family regulator